MGLFDFLKKKEPQQEFDLFTAISRYNEYIVSFIGMHQQGNNAPVSAYEQPDGTIVGFLYVNGQDTSYSLSASDVVGRMRARFTRELAAGKIRSSAIFFHSDAEAPFTGGMSMLYNFGQGEGTLIMNYKISGSEVDYHPYAEFTPAQNNIIFDTKLVSGKNYFADMEEIVPPQVPNQHGLQVSRSNVYNLKDTWSGIFGFHSFDQPGGSDALREHFAFAARKEPVYKDTTLQMSEAAFDDIAFRVYMTHGGEAKTILPVVKTGYAIDVENKGINEWENIGNLEAVVSASGRDTFGISYFATDYAMHRDLYLRQRQHQVQLSGIVFVLDRPQQAEDEFTGYLPNKDLARKGCFDFVGVLEDYRETTLLLNGELKGYIMKVKLINHPETADFFTIDMYVTQENMRFEGLEKGMKLTGMFQLQGQLVL